MLLLGNEIFQISAASLGLFNGCFQLLIGGQNYLTVHKRHVLGQARHLIAHLLFTLADLIIGIISLHRKSGVLPDARHLRKDRFHIVQALNDVIRSIQLACICINQSLDRFFQFIKRVPHLLFISKDQGQIPGFFNGYVFTCT